MSSECASTPSGPSGPSGAFEAVAEAVAHNRSVKQLGTAINGAVDSPVNGGVELYREVSGGLTRRTGVVLRADGFA
jgi:hypothetical protein